MSLGWGLESDETVKKELAANLMPKSKCLEIISSFGIHWTENMTELALTKQYWKISAKYHPDKVQNTNHEKYEQKFKDLAVAVNTLKKYMMMSNKKQR